MENDLSKVAELAAPLAEYLKENCHSYTAIIVTSRQAIAVKDLVIEAPLLQQNLCGIEQPKEETP